MNNRKLTIETLEEHDALFFRGDKIIRFFDYSLAHFIRRVVRIKRLKYLDKEYLTHLNNGVYSVVTASEVSRIIIAYLEDHLPYELNGFTRDTILNSTTRKISQKNFSGLLNFIKAEDFEPYLDTNQLCIINYNNGRLFIKEDSTGFIPYGDDNRIISEFKIKQNYFVSEDKTMSAVFAQFVWMLAGKNIQNFRVFISTIGYLAHRYKNPLNPKMVILVDSLIDSVGENIGGNGKSLFFKAFQYIKNTVDIPGKKHQSDGTFAYQNVELSTDLVIINDVKKNEKIDNYLNDLTDNFKIEKKHQLSVLLSPVQSPKFGMTANHFVKREENNASKRRIQEIEVSKAFGPHLNPEKHFGHVLFTDWDDKEWGRFNQFFTFCIQFQLKYGLLSQNSENLEKAEIVSNIGIELIEFMDEKIEQGVTKFHKKDIFDEYSKGGYVKLQFVPKRINFTKNLKRYFNYKKLAFKETPADKKLYFELITDKSIKEQSQ